SHHDGKAFFRAGLRFALASLIGGGLAMCILLPVVFALQYTSAAGETLPAFEANFALFRVPAQQLFGMVPTIRSGNLPNIFCGVLPVVLVPLLLTTKTVPLRRRLAYGGLVGVLALSFTVNIFDLIWHGLHTPNDLPYRFSFLYVFAVLLAAAAILPHLKDITHKQLGGTFAAIVAYIAVYEALQGEEAQVFAPVYVTLLLVTVYCGIILLIKHGKLAMRSAYTVLAAVCILEMTVSGGVSLDALNGNEYYTDRAGYIANDEHRAAVNAVNKLEELADAAENGNFYRAEFLPMRTCVDTALYHYRGLTSFSSSNYYHTTRLLGYLGYADNGVNSYLYQSFVPSVDALMGLKYLALQSDVNHPHLEKIGTQGDYYLFRNRLALPIAFRACSELPTFAAAMYDPFATQEALYTALTGDDRPLFSFAPIATTPASAGDASAYGDTRFNCSGEKDAYFEAYIENTAPYYIFVDCTAAKSSYITIYDETGAAVNSYDASLNEPYIIDAGTLKADYRVEVSISSEMSVSGNIFVAALDNTVLEEKIAYLQKDGMTVTDFSAHRINGTLNASANGVVFTSIPYDASWTVTVDGKEVETYPIGDLNADGSQGAFLCFDVALGNHDVTFSYMPKGLTAGLLISAISLVAFILLLLITRRKKPTHTVPVSEPTLPVPKKQTEEPPAGVLSDDITLGDLLDDPPTPPTV
ncbi:MAG: YfhO family protein, partial [Clostridia bacterium]|nr:YfhO family protein [Clostridia bacterium]